MSSTPGTVGGHRAGRIYGRYLSIMDHAINASDLPEPHRLAEPGR